jgi:hypothetical protein
MEYHMTTAHMTHGAHQLAVGKFLSHAFNAGRLAFMLLGPVGLMLLAIFLRYTIFEYFHGDEQTLRALWHVVSP